MKILDPPLSWDSSKIGPKYVFPPNDQVGLPIRLCAASNLNQVVYNIILSLFWWRSAWWITLRSSVMWWWVRMCLRTRSRTGRRGRACGASPSSSAPTRRAAGRGVRTGHTSSLTSKSRKSTRWAHHDYEHVFAIIDISLHYTFNIRRKNYHQKCWRFWRDIMMNV